MFIHMLNSQDSKLIKQIVEESLRPIHTKLEIIKNEIHVIKKKQHLHHEELVKKSNRILKFVEDEDGKRDQRISRIEDQIGIITAS